MQDWYANTANVEHVQRETLSEFLHDQQLELPQISLELQEMLTEEITPMEVEEAISKAQETSAPGPSGQTITLFKILNQELPGIFSAAFNQLVFNEELARHNAFKWIKHRKVIYIPKKPVPIAPETIDPSACLKCYTRYHQELLLGGSHAHFPRSLESTSMVLWLERAFKNPRSLLHTSYKMLN
jgi:hypothetical protein